MSDEEDLIRALRLTANPPEAWIEAASLFPSTLGDLQDISARIETPQFRASFEADPHAAVEAIGLEATEPVLAAIRAQLG